VTSETPFLPSRSFARRLGSSIRQLLGGLFRDPGVAALVFGGVLFYSFFYPWPYGGELVNRVPVLVVDQDQSALSRQIVRLVAAHPALALRRVVVEPGAAREALWRNEVAGILVLPDGLAADVRGGRHVAVALSGNGAYLLVDRVVLGAMAEVVGTVSAGITVQRELARTPEPAEARARAAPLRADSVAWFNVREGYGSYVVPGVAVLVIQQTLWIGMALMFGTWRQGRGPFPLDPGAAGFWGTQLAFAAVAWINSLYFFGWVLRWQDYPRAGSPTPLLLFSVLFALCLAALGMALASLFRSRERSAQLLLVTTLPMLFLADLSWPAVALPGPLQTLRWLLPSSAAIPGFIALDQMGAGLADVRRESLVLVALWAGGSLVAGWRWRRFAGDRRTETGEAMGRKDTGA